MRNWISLIILLAPIVGCASFQDWHYMHTQKSRTKREFASFVARTGQYDISKDYIKGWQRGYNDVLLGKSGKAPLIPPRKYWSPNKNGSTNEYGKNEWYQGYQDGATLASLEPDTHYIKLWQPDSHSEEVVNLLPIEVDHHSDWSYDTTHPQLEGYSSPPDATYDQGWNSIGSPGPEFQTPIPQ